MEEAAKKAAEAEARMKKEAEEAAERVKAEERIKAAKCVFCVLCACARGSSARHFIEIPPLPDPLASLIICPSVQGC